MNYIDFKNRKKYEGVAGVYGIFVDDRCVYVGSTRNLSKRYGFHERDTAYMTPQRKDMYVNFHLMKEFGSTIEFRPIITIDDMMDRCDGTRVSESYMLDSVELAFIMFYKPRFNSKGIDMKFTFDHVG